ncbi:hypothetical protein QJS10_CPB20g00893 [Acorus calamus]|uniref:Uncharacterized protein n=1 Tax=Acorus calamus TaxID=4465 RepID=A0AAV9C9H2_ACOCL|nr:hypothetical protein QJS10_CPB20g00893 [Acorus calamus]
MDSDDDDNFDELFEEDEEEEDLHHDESSSTSAEDEPPSTPQSFAIHQWRHLNLFCITGTLLKSLALITPRWRGICQRYAVYAEDVLHPGFGPIWISDYREMLTILNTDLEFMKVVIRASLPANVGLDPPQEDQAFGFHEFMPPPLTVDLGVEFRRGWARISVTNCMMIFKWVVRVVSQRVPERGARYDNARDLDEVFLTFRRVVTRLQEMLFEGSFDLSFAEVGSNFKWITFNTLQA